MQAAIKFNKAYEVFQEKHR